MSGDNSIFTRGEIFQELHHARIFGRMRPQAGIPQRYASIAYQTPPLRAFDGALAEYRAEFLLLKRGEPFQLGVKERMLFGISAGWVWHLSGA